MKEQCLHFFSAVLDLILFILSCNDNIHESLDGFEICLDLTTGFHGNRRGSKKLMILLFLVCYIYLIHFKFVGIKDMHNIYYLGLSGEHRCPLGYLFSKPF